MEYQAHTEGSAMPHSPEDKRRAVLRLRRIRGQVEALERAISAGADCSPVLQQLAALRGAVNSLMAEVLESHLRETLGVAGGEDADPVAQAGIDQTMALVRSYLK
jgi:DNA-binding FrmR family transcriptional regulator